MNKYRIYSSNGTIFETDKHPGMERAFVIGDKPEVAWLGGAILPIKVAKTFQNVIFYNHTDKKSVAGITIADKAAFIEKAKSFDPSFNYSLLANGKPTKTNDKWVIQATNHFNK